jgi:Lipase (class 2)
MKMKSIKTLARHVAAALGVTLAVVGGAQAQTVGTTFPPGFMVGMDASMATATPWIGFGGDKASWPIARTPVVILHGNDGTPYPTGCGRLSMNVQGFAQYLADNGYAPSELWALGWQGSQCDQNQMNGFGVQSGWTKSASGEHTIAANVADLRNFVSQVLSYTGASKVDIVAHGAGVVLAREWVRQDVSRKLVRRFVAIDGPNQGMILCAPVPNNSWALAFSGGFTPESPVCGELGSPNTPFLTRLNRAADGGRISPSDTLVIRNGDSSFPYMPWADGLAASAPASVDIYGNTVDLTQSATLRGGQTITLTGQHSYDGFLNSAHVGIANSPDAWRAALSWLRKWY